jgi:hypothetical protein
MKIGDYPRPAGDTGIGFHWFPDMFHYEERHLELFLPKLKAMGASWLTVLSEPAKPIPEPFIRGLVAAAIEPVVRVYTYPIGPIDQVGLAEMCKQYAAWGVHYVHVYNEPNLTDEWGGALPGDPVQRFMDLVRPCLATMWRTEGIVPVLTPLAPGGNYRDVTFFRQMLECLFARGQRYLFSKLAVGLHNYALNHPLDWGAGGRRAWPATSETCTPAGSQDSNGFRQYEWYDELVRERVGFSLPMVVGENGALPGSRSDANYPAIDGPLHAERHAEMARRVRAGETPEYLFNNAFWILSAADGNMFAGQRWFRDSGEPALVESVRAMEGVAKQARDTSPGAKDPSPSLSPTRGEEQESVLASIIQGEADERGEWTAGLEAVAGTIATRFAHGQKMARILREYRGRAKAALTPKALELAAALVARTWPASGYEFVLSDADVVYLTKVGTPPKVIERIENPANGLGLNLVREYWE